MPFQNSLLEFLCKFQTLNFVVYCDFLSWMSDFGKRRGIPYVAQNPYWVDMTDMSASNFRFSTV
jgi:hypothetical protein